MLRSSHLAGLALAGFGLTLLSVSALAQTVSHGPASLSPSAAQPAVNPDDQAENDRQANSDRQGGDDLSCRSEAASRSGFTGTGDSDRTAQRYAAAYYQCMASDGDAPPRPDGYASNNAPRPPAYGYDSYPYPSPYYYPPYYGPVFMPSLSFGFGFSGGFPHGGFGHRR